MNTFKNIVVGIVIVFIGLSVFGYIAGKLVNEDGYVQSETSKANTGRNSFISGCKSETIKIEQFTDETAQSYCECAHDTFAEMYTDWNNNIDRDNRIINEGYTQAETDAIIKCFPEGIIN